MMLKELLEIATDKNNFTIVDDYLNYAENYLNFIFDGLQAVIVSKNETDYRFFQYKDDGEFNITRPINSRLMYSIENFSKERKQFIYSLKHIHEITDSVLYKSVINNMVYTCQQCIGASLDALPAGKSNTARKINGDLFERFVREILKSIGISVEEGIINVPIKVSGEELFRMSYQHDLIIKNNKDIVAIGSVKTSSKDRIDKVFIDKFLYNRLTDRNTLHFAIFLNDVQRKGREPIYGINTTFLTGHFKGYTIKLNPLDGVYYCDLRPNMKTDSILKKYIKTFDQLLIYDIWNFVK